MKHPKQRESAARLPTSCSRSGDKMVLDASACDLLRLRIAPGTRSNAMRMASIRVIFFVSPMLAFSAACAEDVTGSDASTAARNTLPNFVRPDAFIQTWPPSRPMRQRWTLFAPDAVPGLGVQELPGSSAGSAILGPASKLDPPEDWFSMVGVLKWISHNLPATMARPLAVPARIQNSLRLSPSMARTMPVETFAMTAAGPIDASLLNSQITARSAIGLGGLSASGQVYTTLWDSTHGAVRRSAAVVRVSRGAQASEALVFRMLNMGSGTPGDTETVRRGSGAVDAGALRISFGRTDRAAFRDSARIDVPLPSAFGFSRGRYVNVEFGRGRSAQTRLSFAGGAQGRGSSTTLGIARSHQIGEVTRVSAGWSTTMEINQVTGTVGEGLFDTSGQHVRSTAFQFGMTTQLWRAQLKSWIEVMSTRDTRLYGAIAGLSSQTSAAMGVASRWNNLALSGDALSLGLTLPARTISGYATMVNAGLDGDGNPVACMKRVSLRPTGTERIASMTYSRSVTPTTKIQAGVLLRLEPDHIAHAPSELAGAVKILFSLQ